MTARQYTVRGRVQGVGFRWFVRGAARSLGLTGWVRNLANGEVEAYATGPARNLEQFQAMLEEGPAGASVAHVATQIVEVRAYPGFEIIH